DKTFLRMKTAEVGVRDEGTILELGPAVEAGLPEADAPLEAALSGQEPPTGDDVVAAQLAADGGARQHHAHQGGAGQVEVLSELVRLAEAGLLHMAALHGDGAVEGGSVELRLHEDHPAQDHRQGELALELQLDDAHVLEGLAGA